MVRNRHLPYEPWLRPLAQRLRREGTRGEILLWQQLRNRQLGVQFHRQVPVGRYIIDFFCHELMLAIEVDGSSHRHPAADSSDLKRQASLSQLGIRFLRFDEQTVVRKTDTVVRAIAGRIEELQEHKNADQEHRL
jgi:very-short-patch-repair endonuclease